MTDLLLRDVRLVPLVNGDETGEPVDVLVLDGDVAEVGPGLVALDREGRSVEVVEGQGRWLIPGLWDQHVHLGQWGLCRARLDTTTVTSPEAAIALVAERVHEEPGKPIIGFGHRPGTWSREVTVTELDEVTGVTPVILIAGDAHHAWLNSVALAALGLGHRDEVVRENEWFAAYEILNSLTGDSGTSPPAYRDSLRAAAALGVVGLVDFEFSGGAPEWIERWHAGCDLLRVRMATYADGLEAVEVKLERLMENIPA